MHKRIFIFIVLCLAFLGPIMAGAARAQGLLSLSSLEVDLWPEYDRPEMLVIYRITLPANITLPVDLSLRIPAAAGEPSAVAVVQPSSTGEKSLFTIPYERTVSGDWGEINLTATMPELQLEYYDPGLVRQGAARQFEFNWPGDYAVEALSVQVQQPVGARELSISPASGSGVTGQDGLLYYNKQVGSLTAGQTFSLSINYQKDSDTLSASSLTVQPGAPVSEVSSSQVSLRPYLPWGLGILGVLLIAGGGLWYWRSGRGGKEPEGTRRRRKPASAAREASQPAEPVYCHSCGKRAAPGDRFCRVCGTQLRIE